MSGVPVMVPARCRGSERSPLIAEILLVGGQAALRGTTRALAGGAVSEWGRM